eukprot:m.29888 g.29888  ORF g.29888 m.29888 type:complete len:182 (-) comp6187_c1_seq2:276-821(-)
MSFNPFGSPEEFLPRQGYLQVDGVTTEEDGIDKPLDEMEQEQQVVKAPPVVRGTSSGKKLPPVPMPTYAVNGGMDLKYDAEDYPIALQGFLTRKEYVKLANDLNDVAEKYRAKTADNLLLAGGAMTLVLLIPFATRRKSRAVKRNKGFKHIFAQFNVDHPELLIRRDRSSRNIIIQSTYDD